MFIQVCLFLLLLIKCYGYQSAWNSDHNDHRIPQDVMVDVVNNLALKLLLASSLFIEYFFSLRYISIYFVLICNRSFGIFFSNKIE
jgi:hypothetical protein